MDLLFGTSKKKPEPPKVDINAPTLGETSAKVSYMYTDRFDRWMPDRRSSKLKLMNATHN
jgi:hypothetical protein